MSNRVTVKIGGVPYTVISDDSPEYIEEISAYFDAKCAEVNPGNRMPGLTAAVLAGITAADELYKNKASSESLVNQLREYVAETTRMRAENGELRRELERTRTELSKLRDRQ